MMWKKAMGRKERKQALTERLHCSDSRHLFRALKNKGKKYKYTLLTTANAKPTILYINMAKQQQRINKNYNNNN